MNIMTPTTHPPAASVSYPVTAKPSFLRRHLVIVILISFLSLSVLSVLTFHGYIAWVLTRPVIAPLVSNPLAAIETPYEDVTFAAAGGGSMLEGWYIPAASPSAQTVVFSHGYGGNREEIWVPIYDLAAELHRQQFNVFMFDYGYVKPERVVTAGIQETNDLLGAIDYVKARGAEDVFVWGFSMGAGIALQAALQYTDIQAMVLDSTFLLEPDTLYRNLTNYIQLPRNPSLSLVGMFFPVMSGGASLSQIPAAAVKSAKFSMPLFLIHGKEDEKAPYSLAETIFKNQSSETKLWLDPDGTHELIYRAHKKQYLSRTIAFLKAHSTSAASPAETAL
ncbi:alpha/beta hydrolase [Paenibacillus sp. y28]|uniref:alpha/beta hydrolase n=1 Tax=Paenibacillus sp. y28 TaxID=3129110 RepID=UPI00301B66FF